MSKIISKPNQIRVRLGTIISYVDKKPKAHIFVISKANWENIADDLPQYEAYEPNR